MSAAPIHPELPRLTSGKDAPVSRPAPSRAHVRRSRDPVACLAFGAIATLGAVLIGPAGHAQAPNPPDPRPERPRLEAVVRKLASPELEGRRGEGGRKTAAYLIEEFRRLGLEPLFAGQFV